MMPWRALAKPFSLGRRGPRRRPSPSTTASVTPSLSGPTVASSRLILVAMAAPPWLPVNRFSSDSGLWRRAIREHHQAAPHVGRVLRDRAEELEHPDLRNDEG